MNRNVASIVQWKGSKLEKLWWVPKNIDKNQLVQGTNWSRGGWVPHELPKYQLLAMGYNQLVSETLPLELVDDVW